MDPGPGCDGEPEWREIMSAQPQSSTVPRVTVSTVRALKEARRPVVMVTAYDHPSARLVEQAGVDIVLVGDSLGMTVLGFESTLPVTMDAMVHHTAAVSRACTRALVVADMPFMSFQASADDALRNAGRLLAQGGAAAVKVEGASDRVLTTIEVLVGAGIPVMGHVGLTPQSVNQLGGYRTQAQGALEAAQLLRDCVALERAGAFAIVLECIPAELAQRASELVTIPTIGIGAGAGCDGQVQVFHDLLGIGAFTPRHAKRFAEVGEAIVNAVLAYADEVREGAFPSEAQLRHADPEALAEAELLYAAEREGGEA